MATFVLKNKPESSVKTIEQLYLSNACVTEELYILHQLHMLYFLHFYILLFSLFSYLIKICCPLEELII